MTLLDAAKPVRENAYMAYFNLIPGADISVMGAIRGSASETGRMANPLPEAFGTGQMG